MSRLSNFSLSTPTRASYLSWPGCHSKNRSTPPRTDRLRIYTRYAPSVSGSAQPGASFAAYSGSKKAHASARPGQVTRLVPFTLRLRLSRHRFAGHTKRTGPKPWARFSCVTNRENADPLRVSYRALNRFVSRYSPYVAIILSGVVRPLLDAFTQDHLERSIAFFTQF